jgi:hypothetical protein
MKKLWLFGLIGLIVLAGCIGGNPPIILPTPTPVVSPTPTVQPTITPTPSPSFKPVNIFDSKVMLASGMYYSTFYLRNNTSQPISFTKVNKYTGNSSTTELVYHYSLNGGAQMGYSNGVGTPAVYPTGAGTVCCEIWDANRLVKWDEKCLSFDYVGAG